MLNALVDALPEVVGGSADLAGSNCTNLKVGVGHICVMRGWLAVWGVVSGGLVSALPSTRRSQAMLRVWTVHRRCSASGRDRVVLSC